jgi:ABC-2 family transporter protein
VSRPAIAVLRRDMRTTRVFWAPMAFSYGTFLLIFMESRWVFLATGAALACIAAVTVLGIDDRYQSEPLSAALPGTRRSLVGGRYLGWGVVTAAALVLFLAFTALIRAGFSDRTPGLASLLSVQGTAAFIVGASLAGAVFLPFYFRYGFWRGLWSSLAAGLVLLIAVLYAAPRLVPAGACPLLQAAPTPGPFASTVRGFRALAWFVDVSMGRPVVLAAAAVTLTALIFVSYRISVRSYRNRDL